MAAPGGGRLGQRPGLLEVRTGRVRLWREGARGRPLLSRSSFLRNVHDGFVQRRKAISHRGKLDLPQGSGVEPEWLTVLFSAAGSPALVLEFAEGNRASLFIRSRQPKRRGLVLLRIEDMVMPDNAAAIVQLFEWTLAEMWNLGEGMHDRVEAIEARWRRATLHPS